MTLNRSGEHLEGLGHRFRVVPAAKWRDLTGIEIEYEVPGKFRATKKRRSIYEDALVYARDAFARAGALLPIILDDSSIQVQEYPEQGVVAIIVSRNIAGEEKLVWRKYTLTDDVLQWLRVKGAWPDLKPN